MTFAATKYAEEALLDRTNLVWSKDAFKAFEAALEAPAQPSAYVVAWRYSHKLYGNDWA